MAWFQNGYLKMYLPGGRVVYAHRYLWEQVHGPIPKGGIIHHKDGDRANNDLANLELTQRGPHIIMHRGQPYGMPRSDKNYMREYYRRNAARLCAQAKEYRDQRPEIVARMRERYRTDPVYREERKRRSRESHRRVKQRKAVA